MNIPRAAEQPIRIALRIAFSDYAASGVAAALGLLLVSATVQLLLGPLAAAIASIAAIVCIPPDQVAPRRGKFWHLLPAPLLGLPLFAGVLALQPYPLYLGLLLVPASFAAFLAGAWGKRGAPIAMSIMFALIFPLALPSPGAPVLACSLYFALGAGLYLVYATAANAALNGRYRVQLLARSLLSLAESMRTLARRFGPPTDEGNGRARLVGLLFQQQAALADELQTARDVLLESARTPQRQRLAGMLMHVLELRDHLLACELDLDTLKTHAGHAPALGELRRVVDALAAEVERLADSLLSGRQPAPFDSQQDRLIALRWDRLPAPPASPSPAMLMRGLSSRVHNIDQETRRLVALARGEVEPDLAVVRAAWQLFVSPADWSWRPLLALWRWDAPTTRHAVRAALAIGSAYALSFALPWGTHGYWILLTIAVVLRGSLAQTLERRNMRVAGTLVGCVLAAGILSADASPLVLLVIVSLAQAVAHAFAVRRYLVTAIAATVLGLVQAHLIAAGASPAFDVLERMADTLIGAAIAWAFSYVLPSWERAQLPALVARTLAAQARHARVALGLGQLQAVDNAPEIDWRLARREAYDSLSALVQASRRSLSEPRAVRPPLQPLGRLTAHSFQLLAQLTAIKTMLLLRRGHLEPERIRAPLLRAAEAIERALVAESPPADTGALPADASAGSTDLPDPFESDLNPWVLRRLELATAIAAELRDDARQLLRPPAS